jgi:hypothetical protein
VLSESHVHTPAEDVVKLTGRAVAVVDELGLKVEEAGEEEEEADGVDALGVAMTQAR